MSELLTTVPDTEDLCEKESKCKGHLTFTRKIWPDGMRFRSGRSGTSLLACRQAKGCERGGGEMTFETIDSYRV